MTPINRLWGLALLALLATAFSVGIVSAASPVLDKEYRLINPPQPTDGSKKIEVVEFFYYGCPHCYEMEPALKNWLKRKPADVEFRQQPAVFRENWIPLTKTYFALDALGLLPKLSDKVYSAVHDEGLGLSDEALMSKWIGQQGVDPVKFSETYRSFAVQNSVQRAIQVTRDYQVKGTPSIAVAGKYITSPSMTGGFDRFFEVVDQLIEMARKEAGGKKS
ncbi:MAG: thiol:disulfide interchange protein DsbA/DsbL [Burkholderiales bacterium]|nr:thiol:disulfide interchange protein DsbA/DsbL [Burkholderiales bacterium]